MSKTPDVAVMALAALLLGLSLYTHFAASGVGDTELTLVNSRQLFDGKRLYEDVFTVQPPLIAWLYLLPVALARLTGIPDSVTMILAGLALVALSIAVCDRVLARHAGFQDKDRRWMHAALMAGIFIVATNPAGFFDREHIFVLLVMPYLLRYMPSMAGSPLRMRFQVLIGCMAGLGFCIKPYCLVVFAFIQLIYVVKRNPAVLLHPDNLIVYAAVLLYAAVILIFTPEYFHIVVPMALETYSAVNSRVGGFLFTATAVVILAVALADFSWRLTSPYRQDIFYLLSLCPAFLLYAFLNVGWGYTYYPLLNLCLLLTGWLGMEYLWLKRDAQEHGRPSRSFVFGARACAISLACIMGYSAVSGFLIVSNNCREHLRCSRWGRELIASAQNARSFGAISGDFNVWVRLSDATGMRWDTRFNHLWMLPKFLASDENFARSHQWIVNYVATAFAQDMSRRKPEVMYVDNMDVFYLTPGYVDLVAYLSVFPDFREAWGHYRHAESISTCSHPEKAHCNIEVYRRLP